MEIIVRGGEEGSGDGQRPLGYLVSDRGGTWQRYYSNHSTPADAVREAVAEGYSADIYRTRSPDSSVYQRWRVKDGEVTEVLSRVPVAERPELLRSLAEYALRGGAAGDVEQMAWAILSGEIRWPGE